MLLLPLGQPSAQIIEQKAIRSVSRRALLNEGAMCKGGLAWFKERRVSLTYPEETEFPINKCTQKSTLTDPLMEISSSIFASRDQSLHLTLSHLLFYPSIDFILPMIDLSRETFLTPAALHRSTETRKDSLSPRLERRSSFSSMKLVPFPTYSLGLVRFDT